MNANDEFSRFLSPVFFFNSTKWYKNMSYSLMSTYFIHKSIEIMDHRYTQHNAGHILNVYVPLSLVLCSGHFLLVLDFPLCFLRYRIVVKSSKKEKSWRFARVNCSARDLVRKRNDNFSLPVFFLKLALLFSKSTVRKRGKKFTRMLMMCYYYHTYLLIFAAHWHIYIFIMYLLVVYVMYIQLGSYEIHPFTRIPNEDLCSRSKRIITFPLIHPNPPSNHRAEMEVEKKEKKY